MKTPQPNLGEGGHYGGGRARRRRRGWRDGKREMGCRVGEVERGVGIGSGAESVHRAHTLGEGGRVVC